MFMDNNRKLNGAASPGATAASDAAAQRSAQQLVPNDSMPSPAPSPIFTPNMMSSDAINAAHYQGGLSGSPFAGSYEDKIPSVGTAEADAKRNHPLKER